MKKFVTIVRLVVLVLGVPAHAAAQAAEETVALRCGPTGVLRDQYYVDQKTCLEAVQMLAQENRERIKRLEMVIEQLRLELQRSRTK